MWPDRMISSSSCFNRPQAVTAAVNAAAVEAENNHRAASII
jgi:hypothetical protein